MISDALVVKKQKAVDLSQVLATFRYQKVEDNNKFVRIEQGDTLMLVLKITQFLISVHRLNYNPSGVPVISVYRLKFSLAYTD